MWTSKSNMAIMEELGSRLKEYRIRKNLQQKELALNRTNSFVRLKGLEPPRREASDPKSDVATNYTTAALRLQR